MISLLLLLLLLLPSFILTRECTSDDFIYEYTSCGDNGERWRVAVPRTSSLDCIGNVPSPQKGLNCSFTCGAGNYLDITSQSCRPCNPGTYSLGGGIRFDEFTKLPSGFSVDNIDSLQDIVLDTSTPETSINCPEESGWIVRNTELLYIPSPCVSKLSFSANLVRPGYIEYTYRMPTNSRGLSFSDVVKNEQCQSYKDEVRNLLSGMTRKEHHEETTASGEWQKKRLELRTGPNVISWTVTNSREIGTTAQPIVMARIDIVGIAFTRQCTSCPAGTYSDRAAGECKPCPAGSFSTKGSSECAKCPLSQYSGPKSSHCFDRPPCKQNDFYPVTEPCVNGKTKRTYKKVMPAVCNENAPGAAKLPSDEPETDCPVCNPGMAMSPTGVCTFCQEGFWSDGNDCKHCADDSQPAYGYQYVWWNSLPPHINTRCEFVTDEAWLPSGDAIITAPSLQRGIAFEMTISVEEGFHNPLLPNQFVASQNNPIGTITIVFDTKCADESCAFYFIEDVLPNSDQSFYKFLGAFNGSQPRRVISHSITRRSAARFLVAFIRSGASSLDDSISDQARVFSVNVTNVGKKNKQGGGAASCTPCASGAGGCMACENGKYLDEISRSCKSCPPRTFSNMTSSRVGISSCIQCGPNLDSDGTQCVTSGNISLSRPDNGTREYDLSPLRNKTSLISGVRVFAREGTSYFHHMNVSLLGGKVQCRDTWDPVTDTFNPLKGDEVYGTACRLTGIPVSSNNGTQKLAFVSPTLIANTISAITESRVYNGWTITEKSLGYEGKDRPLDLHVFFEGPKVASGNCLNGTALAVTLRCDPNEKTQELKMLPACPDGTCDGCLYQAILESSIACPLCGRSDYKIIRGECKNGHQTIHSIPEKHCVVSGAEAIERTETCSTISENLKLLIGLGATLLLILLCILYKVFKKNQRLEYKYSKLIESKGGYELAGAESCALEEDEDDEDEFQDRVIFSKGRKEQDKGFFSRLASKSSKNEENRGDRENFATIQDDED